MKRLLAHRSGAACSRSTASSSPHSARLCSDGEVHKWRLDSSGKRLGMAEYTPPAGADNPFVLTIDADDMGAVLEAVEQHEGCRLQGWLALRRVAGNVHFAVRPEAMMAVGESPNALAALVQQQLALHGKVRPQHNAQGAGHRLPAPAAWRWLMREAPRPPPSPPLPPLPSHPHPPHPSPRLASPRRSLTPTTGCSTRRT
jgi:hypothetical protein